MFKLIKPTDSLPERNVVIVIYAQPGTSKTSLSFTSENPLLLDFDEGLERCVGRKDAAKVEAWQDVLNMQSEGVFKNYKTLIIDTAGTCLDNFIAAHVIKLDYKNKKGTGGLSLSGYGDMKEVFAAFIRSLKGIDIILICHAQEKEAAGDRTIVRPKMTGGSYDVIMSIADMVGYMDVQQGKRVLNFNPTDINVGKNSAELPRLELPDYKHKDWPEYMARIIRAVKDRMTNMGEEQRAAAETFKALCEALAAMAKPEDFLAFSLSVTEQPEIYKAQLRKLLNERLKVVGLVYDKVKNVFAAPVAEDPKAIPADIQNEINNPTAAEKTTAATKKPAKAK